MSILATRPSPAGGGLVSRLCTLGQTAWGFPLIEFSSGWELATAASRLPVPTENDLVSALSQHAVTFADTELCQQKKSWPSLPRRFAINRAMALALHIISDFNIHYPLDREISEVLS